MSWFKVDDQLAFNAKVMLAGNSAMGLWVRAGSWSSAQLTGGFIPTHMANAMANAMANPCDADALVMAGLWDEAEGGYQFHDWTDFQPDAEIEKEKRKATSKARSDAGKAGAAARWNRENNGKPDSKSDGKRIANEWQNDAPVPSRPVQSSLSEVSDETPRPDVEELLDLLDSCIALNGFKKPSRTKKNADAARLLLDKDGYDVKQVSWMIRWATNDEFWRSNILSMSKLREKFDQLKAKAGVTPKPQAAGFNGEIDVDAVLGRDVWTPGTPPAGLSMAEEIEWKKQQRAAHKAERLEEAKRKLGVAA